MSSLLLPQSRRELAYRVSGGTEFTLYWSADDGTLERGSGKGQSRYRNSRPGRYKVRAEADSLADSVTVTVTTVTVASVSVTPDSASLGAGKTKYHATNVRRAAAATAGVKTALTRSARRAMGGFPACASSTRRTTRRSAVSAPVRVTRTRSAPDAFSVAA